MNQRHDWPALAGTRLIDTTKAFIGTRKPHGPHEGAPTRTCHHEMRHLIFCRFREGAIFRGTETLRQSRCSAQCFRVCSQFVTVAERIQRIIRNTYLEKEQIVESKRIKRILRMTAVKFSTISGLLNVDLLVVIECLSY